MGVFVFHLLHEIRASSSSRLEMLRSATMRSTSGVRLFKSPGSVSSRMVR